ncbi:MAG TPA: aminotransferase class V-fold PLP-dependent enzyme [Gemmatimonadaceae bacterium]|nr:aminotransferase class V-fold PLP-dependent enzyme [Gemmatimonadaceae bacterium]
MTLSRRSFVATAATLAAGAVGTRASAEGAPSGPTHSGAANATNAANAINAANALGAVGASDGAAAAVGPDAHPTPPAQDPLGVRPDFPVVREGHYLNSAYITPVPMPVVAAGRAFLERKATDPIPLGDMLAHTDVVRGQFARLVNASPDEIGFLFATSEGENIVANALDLRAGDNVVIDALHYETEFVLYGHLRDTRGIELRIAPHRDGAVHLRDVEPLVDRRTKLLSVAWVSHQNGFRHDMRPLADLAHAHGALFYTDAIQAAGMIPLDVRAAGVDFLCCGTYKWVLGGFGVAPFFIRRELLDRIRLDRYGALHVAKELPDNRFELHATAKRFDYATLPFAEVYQLGTGLEFVERVGVARIERHTVALAHRLHAGLAAQGYRLFTPEGTGSSIVTYYFERDPADLKAAFAAAKVRVSVRDAKRQVRVSPALFNTQDEVDHFLEVTKRLR